jgi:hypothetical protein
MYKIKYRKTGEEQLLSVENPDKQLTLNMAEALSKKYRDRFVDVWRVNETGAEIRLIAQFKRGALYL